KCSHGKVVSTFTRLRSSATYIRAKEDCPKKCPPSSLPSRVIGELPSARAPPMRLSGNQVSQYAGWPLRQLWQRPQDVKDITTASPGRTRVTTTPDSPKMPVPSSPKT